MTPPGTSISGPSPILTAAAREIEKATIPCPRCVRGTVTVHGSMWWQDRKLRCSWCQGVGRIYAEGLEAACQPS